MIQRLLAGAGSVVTDVYAELGPFQPDKQAATLERRYTNEASAFLQLEDARIHYRDEGPRDGPAVVLLHGTYSSLHTWDEWVKQLRTECRVVRLDMPGFGLTGPRKGRHTLRILVETVATVCDELGLRNVTVAGNSLGGGVAWRLAVERADLVSRLVLINAGGATLLSNLSSNLLALAGPAAQRFVTPRLFVRLILLDAYHDSSLVTDDLVRRYHDLILRTGNRRAVVEIARNYETDHYDQDRHDRGESSVPTLPSRAREPSPNVWDSYDISAVSVPTLFQWGTEDEWLPCSFGQELARKVHDSQFVTYPEVGHIPMEEAPHATVGDVRTFIGGEWVAGEIQACG